MSTNCRIRFPYKLLIPLFLGVALTTGCQTTVGNYLGNRGRDFGECFLVQGGFGLGLAADVKVAGLAHVSVGPGFFFPSFSIGAVYGEGRPAPAEIHGMAEGDNGLPISLFQSGMLHHSGASRWGHPAFGHGCYGILPGVLSWVAPGYPVMFTKDSDARWLWSSNPLPEEHPDYGRFVRWSRIHAFDVEVGVFALILGARAGFSPGEFVDFLLGWFGVDIAGDDRTLKSSEE